MADKATQMDGVYVKLIDLSETVVVGSTIHEGEVTEVTEAVHALAVGIMDGEYFAVTQGQAWRAWQQDFMPGADPDVLATETQTETGGSGICLDLVDGRTYYITQIHYGIHTVSDNCVYEIGYTPYSGGSGTFVPLACDRSLYTGVTRFGHMEQCVCTFVPPLRVPTTAACITFRVDANDATCEICCEHAGYWV